MADKGPNKRKLKHALIWWIKSQQKSVVPASKIPRDKQFADAITDLWWSEGGKRTKFQAKIIALSLTESEVKSANLYATALKMAYQKQQKMGNNETKQTSDSFHHTHAVTPEGIRAKIDAQIEMNNYSPGDDKVELWPGCRFYLHSMDYAFVKKSSTFNGVLSWGVLVTNMLIEIYGQNVAHYSATGHRLSKSPGIDKRLYRGLYGWVENVTKSNDIDISVFNAHINHLISNKRRYMPEFGKSQKKAKTGMDTSMGKSNLEDCPIEEETSTSDARNPSTRDETLRITDQHNGQPYNMDNTVDYNNVPIFSAMTGTFRDYDYHITSI